MAGSVHVGRFVWHDLMTSNAERAQRFYAQLFGWTYNKEDMGGPEPYTMVFAGQQGLGGINAGCGDAPPQWTSYVEVADIRAAVDRVQALRGGITFPVTEIPRVGWFAVVQDPQGGHLSLFQNREDQDPVHMNQPLPTGPGTFCWHELLARDPLAAVEFYRGVFGWGHATHDMGEMGTYHLFTLGEEMVAGMMPMPPDAGGSPAWLPYIAVEDVDASAARTVELGGTICVPPTDIPDVGRFSVATDPDGALFAHFRGA